MDKSISSLIMGTNDKPLVIINKPVNFYWVRLTYPATDKYLDLSVDAMDAAAEEWCKRRGIVPGLSERDVAACQELECQADEVRAKDTASMKEWEHVAEIEEQLAEIFTTQVLPQRVDPQKSCSTIDLRSKRRQGKRYERHESSRAWRA